MATDVVVPVGVKTDLATYCLVETKDGVEFMTEKKANKAVEAKEGEIVASQTYGTKNISTEADFSSLVPDAEERVRLINRALDQKQYQSIYAEMTETDKEQKFVFQPKDGVVDLADVCAEKVTARAVSTEDKIGKVLKGVDAAQQKKLLEAMLARLG